MIYCRQKKASRAVQWNGSNIREMMDFLRNDYNLYLAKMSKGDYVVIDSITNKPHIVIEDDFKDFYEITGE